MAQLRRFFVHSKPKNRLNFSVEDVFQKDYAITKRRSFASFSFIASQNAKSISVSKM